MRITSSWTCEEAEVRDSRQQAQGFNSERCTSCRWCRYGPCGPPRPDPYQLKFPDFIRGHRQYAFRQAAKTYDGHG